MRIVSIFMLIFCLLHYFFLEASYKNHRPAALDKQTIQTESQVQDLRMCMAMRNFASMQQKSLGDSSASQDSTAYSTSKSTQLPAYLKESELELSPTSQADLAAERVCQKIKAGCLAFLISDAKTHLKPFRFINTLRELLDPHETTPNSESPDRLTTTTHQRKKCRPEK